MSHCRSKRLKDSLIEGAKLVSAGEVGVRLLGFRLVGNVFLETALVLKEFLVFFLGKGRLLAGRGLVISHIHILQVLFLPFILNILKVRLNFGFVLGSEIDVRVLLNLLNMLLLQTFKSEAVNILCHELLVFFLLVEGRRGEFKTPMRSVGLREGSLWIIGPPVVDVDLVVESLVEGPGVLFVKAMVNYGQVGIGRIREKGLSLEVIVNILLVCVRSQNLGGRSNCGSSLGHEHLLTLDVLRLVKLVVGGRLHTIRILLQVFVETHKVVVEEGLVLDAVNDGVHPNRHAVEVGESAVSVVVFHVGSHARLMQGIAHVSSFAILVNSPQIVHALVNRLVVRVAQRKGGGQKPETHI